MMELLSQAEKLRQAVLDALEDERLGLPEAAALIRAATDILACLAPLAARLAEKSKTEIPGPRRDVQCDRSATCS
jgi:hypothetical protein